MHFATLHSVEIKVVVGFRHWVKNLLYLDNQANVCSQHIVLVFGFSSFTDSGLYSSLHRLSLWFWIWSVSIIFFTSSHIWLKSLGSGRGLLATLDYLGGTCCHTTRWSFFSTLWTVLQRQIASKPARSGKPVLVLLTCAYQKRLCKVLRWAWMEECMCWSDKWAWFGAYW